MSTDAPVTGFTTNSSPDPSINTVAPKAALFTVTWTPLTVELSTNVMVPCTWPVPTVTLAALTTMLQFATETNPPPVPAKLQVPVGLYMTLPAVVVPAAFTRVNVLGTTVNVNVAGPVPILPPNTW